MSFPPLSMNGHGPRQFDTGQVVNVPPSVHARQSARVVGYEWGPDRMRGKHSTGWLYAIAFAEGGEHWEATEEELIAWQQ